MENNEPNEEKISPEDAIASLKKIQIDDKEFFIVGTAHISKESVEDVEKAVELVDPDTICVELCEPRYQSIVEKDKWKKMDIFKVVKEKKSLFLLIQLILSSFYDKLGKQLDVPPGAEMLKGIELAKAKNKKLILADRKIEITLKRVWGGLSLWGKAKMFFNLSGSLFVTEKIDSDTIENMKQSDQLESSLEELAKNFPGIKHRLIDERDIYLAEKIRTAPGKRVVAVVGAGHVNGICHYIHKENDLEEISSVPPPSLWPKVFAWSIPTAFVAILLYGFFQNGVSESMASLQIWVLVNGIFAAVGVAFALGHPLTILAAFVASPLTSLNPMIAAGWVCGLVQAYFKRPTVRDVEDLKASFSSFKGVWLNPVSRVLLVVILANLGSSLGSFVAGSWIITRFLGS
ncbi:TraB/GumN family protein [Chitinispirillales bacterium ANBcel5]|uniref:TraB/GumN family protein n=1 Tax=Cellulosispirillum alkaliphilum TaxID=3039283 RepID=UPI002A55C66B|nr:TraB/GumN family protein [Chitinispirillales bacterium ANBcel5]